MLDKYKVNLVLWAMEPWYQRVKDPKLFPAFIGAGFAGEPRATPFRPDSRLQKTYYEMPALSCSIYRRAICNSPRSMRMASPWTRGELCPAAKSCRFQNPSENGG
jgi:hypothetical protein